MEQHSSHHLVKQVALGTTHHRMLMGFRQRYRIAHALLGLIVSDGVDQIEERRAHRHPLRHFDAHHFCPDVQVEETNTVHAVVLQDARPTLEDRRTLAWLYEVLEQP